MHPLQVWTIKLTNKKNDMKTKKTTYSMVRTSMYGHYYIVKETPSGKTSKALITDSQLFDDYNDGKRVQSRLKAVFDAKIGSFLYY